MEIRSGLVPKWVADRLNGRRDDTAGNGRGKGIAESERANDGSDPPAAVLPAPAATAALNVPVSTSEKDQSMQRSSPGGRPLSPRTVTAALYAPEGTTDENQSEQLSELRGYHPFPEIHRRCGSAKRHHRGLVATLLSSPVV